MHTHATGLIQPLMIASFCLAAAIAAPLTGLAQADHHPATPVAAWSCDSPATPAANMDMPGMGAHDDPSEATPEFDQLYLDMMLPHHGSVIALSEAALPHLTDPRLIEMAENIIAAQSDENAMLTEWRTEWYGSGEPETGDAAMMHMLEVMPVGTMDDMMMQMDPGAQVSAFCTAPNPDLAFIDQVIPHHQMAVAASVIAVDKATHPELSTFAEGVITAQQGEIDELTAIRAELEATPAS